MQIGTMQRLDTSSSGQTTQLEARSELKFTGRLLDSAEVQEHIGVAEEAMDHLSQYVYGKVGSPVAEIPDYPADERN